MFHTDFVYKNREQKALYVHAKYGPILKGRVLDVGADQGYLSTHLSGDVEYTTVGLEPHHNVRADLEQPIPLPSASFDCVLCMDVLEHVDAIYQLFDELCRVSRRYVIISLPNPWANFITTLRAGYYEHDRPMKFYSLPPSPLPDRHKWFFAASEAKRFIQLRGELNGMQVLQIDQMGLSGVRKQVSRRILRPLVHPSISLDDLLGDTVWAVIAKP
jgi:SAM-dependent methyltransferase